MSWLVKEVFRTLYECFGGAFLLAFLFMYFYKCVRENGLKATLIKWKQQFTENSSFRKVFILVFYVCLVLMKTILGRSVWYDPYGKIFSGWQIIDSTGKISSAVVANIIMFIPFTFLVMWNVETIGIKKGVANKILLSMIIGFLFSFGIELIQLLTRLGTFQFSDIFYNTVGGIVGAGLYIFLRFVGRSIRKSVR